MRLANSSCLKVISLLQEAEKTVWFDGVLTHLLLYVLTEQNLHLNERDMIRCVEHLKYSQLQQQEVCVVYSGTAAPSAGRKTKCRF